MKVNGNKLSYMCTSVAKQYNLVAAKGSDLFGWESNRVPSGK